jgi:long-chain acyl-CoA synthetase
MVAAVAGSVPLLAEASDSDKSGGVYLAYLPLAHVLEFVVEHTCIFSGFQLGYGSPRTLTDASVRNCLGDIRELRPTFMAGVPAVWETIRKGVQAKLESATPAQQFVFKKAYDLKKGLMRAGLPHHFMDKSVFKKIQDGTGGRLKLALSGGAPMAAETQEFLNVTLCTILQGYGMTETCGAISLQPFSEKAVYGIVGAPFPCTEVKLVKTNTYNPNPRDGSRPAGEVWVRGPNIMKGY